MSLASGAEGYARYMNLLASPVGKVVMLGLTFCVFYHLTNGLRHLAWDFGKGFELKTADVTALLVIASSVTATAAVWIVANL